MTKLIEHLVQQNTLALQLVRNFNTRGNVHNVAGKSDIKKYKNEIDMDKIHEVCGNDIYHNHNIL